MALRDDINDAIITSPDFDYGDWGNPTSLKLKKPLVLTRYGGTGVVDGSGAMRELVEVIVLVGQTRTSGVYNGLAEKISDLKALLRTVPSALPDLVPVTPEHEYKITTRKSKGQQTTNTYVGASLIVVGDPQTIGG